MVKNVKDPNNYLLILDHLELLSKCEQERQYALDHIGEISKIQSQINKKLSSSQLK